MRWLTLTTLVLGCAHVPPRPCTVVTPELPIAAEELARIRPEDFVTLYREACLGSCPIYSVTVFGNGRVVASGEHFVARAGSRSWEIDPVAAVRLLAELTRNNVAALEPRMSALIEDLPGARLEGNIGGQTIAVKHYGAGVEVEMGRGNRDAEIATRLERLIDQISEVDTRVVGCVVTR
jgi:hypothetical protein